MAALVLAVLALPAVVNAIMAKAAEQADADWLRDGDGDRASSSGGELPDLPPPPGVQPPRPRDGGSGNCRLEPRGPDPVVLRPPVAFGASGEIPLATEPGDAAVLAAVDGREVTGRPVFRLREAGQLRWEHMDMHFRESFRLPPGEHALHRDPAPGTTWTLSYEVSGVLHGGITLQLAALRCAGAGR